MFGMGKMFGRKARQAGQAVVKFENRDLAQAAIYGCYWVASADGEIGTKEMDKTDRLLRNAPQLSGFGAELGLIIDRAKADYLEGGARIIRMNAKKELGDLAHDPDQAGVVLNFMLTVAEADGEIQVPAEMDVLEQAAGCLNLRLKDFL